MTRKNYEAIAEIVRNTPISKKDEKYVLVRRLCGLFLVDNPRFDKNKFIDACESK